MTLNQLRFCKLVAGAIPLAAMVSSLGVGAPLWCSLLIWFLLALLTSPLATIRRWDVPLLCLEHQGGAPAGELVAKGGPTFRRVGPPGREGDAERGRATERRHRAVTEEAA